MQMFMTASSLSHNILTWKSCTSTTPSVAAILPTTADASAAPFGALSIRTVKISIRMTRVVSRTRMAKMKVQMGSTMYHLQVRSTVRQ